RRARVRLAGYSGGRPLGARSAELVILHFEGRFESLVTAQRERFRAATVASAHQGRDTASDVALVTPLPERDLFRFHGDAAFSAQIARYRFFVVFSHVPASRNCHRYPAGAFAIGV